MRILLAGLLLVSLVAGAPDMWEEAGRAWWSDVEVLASDHMGGRMMGSQGYKRAAAYVAGRFEAEGLVPAGTGGYFQSIEFNETILDPTRSSLGLVVEGKVQNVAVPQEALLSFTPDSAKAVDAPIVFAGYGLSIPEAHFNDLEGLPVRGAIVAYLGGGPNEIDGDLRSHHSSTAERWKALREAGAIGMIGIENPEQMQTPWERQGAAWDSPQVSLADEALDATQGLQFTAAWNPAKAEDLLAGSGHTFREILDAAKAQQPVPRFALAVSIRAKLTLSTRRFSSKNVAGMRLGTDLKLRNDFVVISAHLDHLGTGEPVRGSSVYHGAMDNASGVASLIEIARALRAGTAQTKRSILFLALTGEETGELGSAYFTGHPTVKGRLVADLNMDMFLPLFPLKWLEVQGLKESSLGADAQAVAEQVGVHVQVDKEPEQNRFTRSDQYSFVKKGIPAVAFKFGYVPGDPEEKIFKDWYAHRYHGFADDANQPVDLVAAAKFNTLIEGLALRVANAPQSPKWTQSSYFRRFANRPD